MAKQPQLWLGQPDRYARLKRIESLDPQTDYLEISSLFYGDFRSIMMPLPFAGFMTTFASPRISQILSSTGELEHRFAKRAVDTSLFAMLVHTHGFKTEIGRAAARSVNAMHKKYDIHPDDFILVACDPPIFSLQLAEKYGWRPVTEIEREALRLFYTQQARAFGSPNRIPNSIEAMKALVSEYFDSELRFEPQNLRMARTALNWYSGLAPRLLQPVVRTLLLAMLDARVVRACGLRPVPPPAALLADLAMKMLGRRDPVPDAAPDQLEAVVRTVYPNGWDVSMLGPTRSGAGGANAEDGAEAPSARHATA